jgi:predicted  nucleic acid-binding Zn-ribbon protein
MVHQIDPETRQNIIFSWLNGVTYEDIATSYNISKTTAYDNINKVKSIFPDLDRLHELRLMLDRGGVSPQKALDAANYVARAKQSGIREEALPEYIGFLESLKGDMPALFAAAGYLEKKRVGDGLDYKDIVNQYNHYASLVKECPIAAQQLAPLKAEHDEKKRELEKINADIEVHLGASSKLSEEINAYESVLKPLRNQELNLRSQIETLKKDLSDLSAQRDAKESELKKVQDEINAKKEDLQNKVNKHQQWLKEKDREGAKIKSALHSKRNDLEAVEERMKELDDKQLTLSNSIKQKQHIAALITMLESPDAPLDRVALVEALLAITEGIANYAPKYRKKYVSQALDDVARFQAGIRQSLMEELKRVKPVAN